MKKAVLWKKHGTSSVTCLACSWYCRITPGQTGICGTRHNDNGTLYSLVYGKAVGLSVDPVEKKPLHHVLPGHMLLSFGTLGCNFGCDFCQNDWMSQATKKRSISDICRSIDRSSVNTAPAQLVDNAVTAGASGIAYTYNEPAIFIEYALETAKIAKKHGLINVFVSNGYESAESFYFIRKYIDAINIDLKSFRQEFYRKICHAEIGPVRDNIKRYFKSGIETEVTTLIIPHLNDSSEELNDIASFLYGVSPDLPWHVSAFSPAYRMTDIPPTPPETVLKAWNIGKKNGLRYVYTGNISDARHSATVCPKCDSILVARVGYDTVVTELDLSTGTCKKCRQKIYGRWS